MTDDETKTPLITIKQLEETICAYGGENLSNGLTKLISRFKQILDPIERKKIQAIKNKNFEEGARYRDLEKELIIGLDKLYLELPNFVDSFIEKNAQSFPNLHKSFMAMVKKENTINVLTSAYGLKFDVLKAIGYKDQVFSIYSDLINNFECKFQSHNSSVLTMKVELEDKPENVTDIVKLFEGKVNLGDLSNKSANQLIHKCYDHGILSYDLKRGDYSLSLKNQPLGSEIRI